MHSPWHLIVRSVAVAGLVASLGSAVATAQTGPGGPGGPGGPPASPPPPAPYFNFDPAQKAGAQGGSWDSIKALPDWSGDWTLDDASFGRVRDASDSPDRNNPNVPKLVQKMWDYRILNKVQNKGADGQGAKNNAATCIPDGMPGIMSTPMGHEYLFTPGRVTIIMENGEVRRIHTDGRKHSDDPDLKFSGDEIGYWVHGTLIVETRYILPKAEFFVGLPGAPDTVVLERFRKIGPKKMQIETIVSNPHVFTEPFRYVRSYDRQDDLEEQLCQENNRDTNGTLDLTPP
jgi:hypothetical protein